MADHVDDEVDYEVAHHSKPMESNNLEPEKFANEDMQMNETEAASRDMLSQAQSSSKRSVTSKSSKRSTTSSKRSSSSRKSSSTARSDKKMPATRKSDALAEEDQQQQQQQQQPSTQDVRPGFTYVKKSDDTRVSRKVRNSQTEARPGTFTTVSSTSMLDDRIARKQRGEQSITSSSRSASASASASAVGPPSASAASKNDGDNSNKDTTAQQLRPGSFTAVSASSSSGNDRLSRKMAQQGAAHTAPVSSKPGTATSVVNDLDDRVARKQRGDTARSTSVASGVADFNKRVDNETLPQPGTVTSVAASSNDRISRKIQGANGNKPGTATPVDSIDARISRKMSGAAAATAGKPQQQPQQQRPGAYAEKTQDDRITQKQRGGAATAAAGAAAVMTLDERIAAKQAAQGRPPAVKPGAVAATDDSKVQRKSAGPGANAVGAEAATDMDERIRQKRISNGLEAESASKPKAPMRPGSFACQGDDPAARKQSYVQDELFKDEDGESIDEDEYIDDVIQNMSEGKDKEKQMTNAVRDAMKEGAPDGELTPGAYSVKTPVWAFLRGRGSISMSRRSKFGSKRSKSGLNNMVSDTEIEEAMHDYIDEDMTWWESLDKSTLCIGIFIICCVVLGIVIPVTSILKDKNAPEPIDVKAYEDVLYPVSGKGAFGDPLSPQSKAFDWIVYDDQTPAKSPALIQRYTLMVMYFANNGEKWKVKGTKWGSDTTECDWDYTECESCDAVGDTTASAALDNGNVRVRKLQENVFARDGEQCISSISLMDAGMSNKLTIPSELLQLSSLETFDAAKNTLTGEIPTELYSLTKLKAIYLEKNSFTGTINDKVGDLSDLHVYSVYENLLTGPLPDTMKNLANLKRLWVSRNAKLAGPLFDFVLNWPMLEDLEVSRCAFEGSIPSEIANLSNLKTFILDDNRFFGSIPTEIGRLSSLTRLVASRNIGMNGSIPIELGGLQNLIELRLDSINLSGGLPSELGNLGAAKIINLSQNELDGTVPTELGRCLSLAELSLFLNDFVGTVPSELGQLSQLTTLYLQRNDLIGQVPSDVCDLRDNGLVTFISSCTSINLECSVPDCCTQCTF